ncbi:efflux RND transporter periplasmic adaptor subunit [Flagellimonas sp. HMM57]|uniref:efflux RND transporter periplasmic adaptor subunit n=1 Tax=unclassified Flagellimonas TaxID=2644544 RepID=UPI0013D294F0|nr:MULTISPECIES: efflux RND transporter periplasmic adaptor subunit [unclassified Flagellimonas]UII74785.1 efflux RND transporter periplasmic adaptor subunit [Flagellimonas sp. HMM57]
MKSIVRIISIGLLTSMLFSCSEKKEAQTRKPKLVKYTEVGFNNQNGVVTYNGVVQQELVINLSFRASGMITKLPLEMGQKVAKGDLLAVLDNVSSRLAYEQAVTQSNAAKSNRNTAKSALDRILKLYEKGSASLSDFEQAKNNFKAAEENYQAAKRTISIRQDQVNYGYIYAPADGIIAAVNSEVNENVNAGQTVATLNAGEVMEIVIGVPENVINTITKNDVVTVRLPSLQNQEFKGTVTEVAPALSAQLGTYPVRVALEKPTAAVKTGMAAAVDFFPSMGNPSTIKPEALVVPAQSVGEDYEGHYVFLIAENDTALIVQKRQVAVGELTENGFEITQGIQNGDRIATAGLQSLLDGQSIRLE